MKEGDHRPPIKRVSGKFEGDLAGLLASLLIGLFATWWPYHLDDRFYFCDDEQTQNYPYMLEIGQQLHQGHWPFLTLSTMNGGNLILDWQYALFNPVSLLSYWLMAGMREMTILGLLLAGFYICLISLGGYLLSRSMGIGRMLSVVAAAVLCTNNYLIYIYSHSWTTLLIGSAWFLWAWSFLQFYRVSGKGAHLAGVFIFGYLTLSAGYPHAIFMLAILVTAYLVEMSWDPRCPRSRPFILASGMAGLLLLLSPALLPAILSQSWTAREFGFASNGKLMPNLGDFLNMSTLDLTPRLTVEALCPVPAMHLAWFIVPLLPFFRWTVVVKTLSERWALGLGGLAALLFLFGPEIMGPLRWPIRFLPLAQTVVLLGFLLVIDKGEVFVITYRRTLVCGALVLLSFTSSTSVHPRMIQIHLLATFFLGWLTWGAYVLIRAKAFPALRLWLLFGVLACYTGTHHVFTVSSFPDFGTNSHLAPVLPSSEKVFNGYTLCLGDEFTRDQTDWSQEALMLGQGIFLGEHTVNGYTAVGHRTLRRDFLRGNGSHDPPPAGVVHFFSTEPSTRQTYLDLIRVNTLIVNKEGALPLVRPLLNDSWKETNVGHFTVRYERVNRDLKPTTLSWATPGAIVTPVGKPTGEHETLHLDNTPTATTLVFARLWWPGYTALLNGVPVKAFPLADLLVGIQLPPHAEGTLVLTYTPPGYHIGLGLSLVGLLVIVGTFFLDGRAKDQSIHYGDEGTETISS